jgi:PAS domain S-box-containing protein
MGSVGLPSSASTRIGHRQEHSVQFYEDDGFLINELRQFIGSALTTGCSAVVIATKAHRENLSRKLKSYGVDVFAATREGRYLAYDAADLLSQFTLNNQIDSAQFTHVIGTLLTKASAASKEPSRRVVAFGEMVALLWAEGKAEAAIQLEKLWNGIAKTYSFSLRCAYPIQGFSKQEDARLFQRVCQEHSHVIPEHNAAAVLSTSPPQADRVSIESDTGSLGYEADWQKNETKFKLMVEAVQDYAIFMLDPEGRIRTWNAGAERIKGYSPSEIIGKHFSCFYPREDVGADKPARLLKIAAREGRVEDEGWRIRKDGSKFWASVTITAIHDDVGRLIGFGKVTKDLTQQKRAESARLQQEHRFQLFVHCVQDYALFLLDPDGYVTTWNIGAERIKGYKASEIIGQHFSIFYPAGERAAKPKYELEEAARTGRFEDESWRLRKDGSKFWANVIITALRDETGRLLGFGKVTRDLTARMQAEKSLEESESKLRDLSLHLLRTQDEERRRIGREIHDSLGQYLSVLKIKLDSMTSSTASRDEAFECANLAEECVKEVRTISYLLYPPMLEEMGLKSAIPWYLEGFSKRSGIETSFEIPDDFHRMSRDAELVLFRVLQESLTNVQRHSGSSSAAVVITENGKEVALEVTDQGKGMPPAVLEQGGQDWMGSLGVGLRGMSERLRQLGGTLDLSSNESGTRVRATLPVRDNDERSNSNR